MKLNFKQREILEYLIRNRETNMDEISQEFDLGYISLKKNLEYISEFVLKFEGQITNKKGQGIKFTSPHNEVFWNIAIVNNSQIETYEKIILSLVKESDPMPMHKLADCLFVSNSYINKQVDMLIVEGFPLDKIKNQGIVLNTSKFEKKKIAIKIIKKYLDRFRLENSLVEIIYEEFDYKINQSSLIGYRETICKIPFSVKDEDYNQFILMLILDDVLGFDELIQNVVIKSFFTRNLDTLSTEFWMGVIKKDFNLNLSKLLIDMIKHLDKEQGFYYDFEIEDFNNLMEHLDRIVTLKNSMFLNDDILVMQNHFKVKYPYAYQSGEYAKSFLEDTLNYKLGLYESLYLGIYFQMHLEKNQKSNMMIGIVVCEYGFGMSTLVKGKINSKIGSVNVTNCYSRQDFIRDKDIILPDVDIVFSTIKTMELDEDITVIYVDVLNFDLDVIRIEENLLKLKKKRFIDTIWDDDFIYLDSTFTSKEDILNKIGTNLEVKDLVTTDYIGSVINRDMDKSFASSKLVIPHGNPQFVSKSKLVIIVLNEPVIWSGEDIYVIVWFVVSHRDLDEYGSEISDFYRLLSEEYVPNKFRRIRTKEVLKNEILKSITKEKDVIR